MGTLHANNPREAVLQIDDHDGRLLAAVAHTIREMICASIDVIVQAASARRFAPSPTSPR